MVYIDSRDEATGRGHNGVTQRERSSRVFVQGTVSTGSDRQTADEATQTQRCRESIVERVGR